MPDGIDKLIHGLLFFIETYYLARSLRHLNPRWLVRSGSTRPEAVLPAAIAIAILVGALTETIQLWVPHRDGSGADLIADALGAFAYGAWCSRPKWAGMRSTP